VRVIWGLVANGLGLDLLSIFHFNIPILAS
jgi:hypothetical protein